MRFNYQQNTLLCVEGIFDLDAVREFLLGVDPALCSKHKIKTIIRQSVSITDSVVCFNGRPALRREISLSGHAVPTYDWDTIFFTAGRSGLIQLFINESTRHRKHRAEADAFP